MIWNNILTYYIYIYAYNDYINILKHIKHVIYYRYSDYSMYVFNSTHIYLHIVDLDDGNIIRILKIRLQVEAETASAYATYKPAGWKVNFA